MNRVVHFEIHAENPERAAKFYTELFGWDIKKWEMPDGSPAPMEYWMVMTAKEGEGKGDTWQGINGGLLRRKTIAPAQGQAVNAFVCTIDVANIDGTLEKMKTLGGSIALEKMPLVGMALLAYGIDTEGNIFGIMQEDKNAK